MSDLQFYVLKALSQQPNYGWNIGKAVRSLSQGAVPAPTGALYPSLLRMVSQGWITTDGTGTSPKGVARYYYRITPLGTTVLQARIEALERMATLV